MQPFLNENISNSFNFIPLRVTSPYSLLQGAITMKKISQNCTQNNIPAVAIVDNNNLFGALEFCEHMSSDGIQPIIGCNLAVIDGKYKGFLPLLCSTREGYKNLIKLSSEVYINDHGEEQVSLDRVLELNDGLICLSGGDGGIINNLFVDSQKKEANEIIKKIKSKFLDRFYIELQRTGLTNIESDLLESAYSYEIPLVATNPSYFNTKEEYTAHDALLCINQSTTVDASDRFRLTPEFYFKTPAQMIELFSDIPEAVENTVEIAMRCSYKVATSEPKLPRFSGLDLNGEASEFKKQAEIGLEERLRINPVQDSEKYRERLKSEIDIITKMEFPGYFLIVADFIKWSKNNNIPVGPGRGSGAGSLVAWALTITDLDPIRFNLIFERFLNPERISLPDFDIDFCQERRDEVINYVQEKYGKDKVAQIITFGTLQSRAVLRDVGRVLGLPYGQVDRICKLIPNNPANPTTLGEAIKGDARIRDESDEDPDIEKMLNIGLSLEGLYRNASTHAAGLVIGDNSLQDFIPLYRDPRSSMPVTQFKMKWAEASGLVKFDFLGLKTLTVIDKTIQLIKEKTNQEIDILQIPLDDEKTFKLLSTGNAIGIFQLESSGMRDVLRNLEPDCFEDIIALVALYRPGPMENIPKYIACKKGEEKPDYMDPLLEDVLKETNGVIIYQEQVMQIAQILANYSLGEADILRRAMGKKIKSEMDDQKERFVNGALNNGIKRDKANYIFDLVAKFAGYGFNKSHAAAYALIAYQTAYLKTYFPEYFLTALMTMDIENTDKLSIFANECKRMDIKILPPSVNYSLMRFDVQDGAIRYGLGAIKNASQQSMVKINDEVLENGNFKTLHDFAQRLDHNILTKKNLENLSYAGAFDEIEPNRNVVYSSVDILSNISTSSEKAKSDNQENFFGEEFKSFDHISLPSVPIWTNEIKLQKEFSAIGFYLTGHPLEDYEDLIERQNITSYSSAIGGDDYKYKIAGTISYIMERRSKGGKRFAFVGLTDSNGPFEITIFSNLLSRVRDQIVPGISVIIDVEIQREKNNNRLLTNSITPINEFSSQTLRNMKIYIDDPQSLKTIKSRLNQSGKSQVSICFLSILNEAHRVEISLGSKFYIDPSIINTIKDIDGVSKIEEI
ncbi:DNA polymerase III subunit alpha [Hyphomicrobiales bacterium]|nr:DNA polymerase III subunit alpha [Hyphomicrobiales bacterium]